MYGLTGKQVAIVFGIGVVVGTAVRTTELVTEHYRTKKHKEKLTADFVKSMDALTGTSKS